MQRILGLKEMEMLAGAHPAFAPIADQLLIEANVSCEDEGCSVFLECVRRPADVQLLRWAEGREAVPGKDPKISKSWRVADRSKVVTDAFPGESPHQAGLALDAVLRDDKTGLWLAGGISPDPRWSTIIGRAAALAGAVWGGLFPKLFDGAHAQHPRWREIARGGR